MSSNEQSFFPELQEVHSRSTAQEYYNFLERFKLLAQKHPNWITNTLGNIFTMRLIGNKTHGDLAEVGISEFINQFMYDFKSKHVGKDLFRAKTHEEDIVIINELSKASIPISLKAYGKGPLQLSTDKDSILFPYLQNVFGDEILINDPNKIKEILTSSVFASLRDINVMPLIYDEANKQCNIMVFDYDKALKSTHKIEYIKEGSGRKYPIFRFADANDGYVFEVRYGNASANALQRGLWTHTINALTYFNSVTNGWISYEHNLTLVKLLSLALNATETGHESANVILQTNIDNFKRQ